MPRLGITTASHGTLVLSHIWKNSLESLPLLGQSAKSLSNLNGACRKRSERLLCDKNLLDLRFLC